MKKFKSIFATLFLTGLLASPFLIQTGCKTALTHQELSVNTLFATHKVVDLALDTYLDLIVKGQVSTNFLPKVTAKYNTFQQAYLAAVNVVAGSTNSVAPQSLLDAANDFTATVKEASVLVIEIGQPVKEIK